MYRFSLLALTVAGLSACDAPSTTSGSATSEPLRIATEADFAKIAGKTLTLDGNDSVFFVFGADGTLTGTTPGGPVMGTHAMRDGFWCRTLTQGAPRAPRQECQVLVLDGDKLTGTRDRGKGSSFTYIVS